MSEMKNVVQKGGVKDMISKKHTKVTTGVFIPGDFLSQAEITGGDIEIAVAKKEIRIYPAKSNVEKKGFYL